MNSGACQLAKEVIAWVSSGNSVPTELATYLMQNHPGFWADLAALKAAMEGAA